MPTTQTKPASTKVTPQMMRLWMENKLNVLLIGRHGVGKSQMTQAFWYNEMGLTEGETCKYLSASTLDPWVDLVGIPKEGDDHDIDFIQLEVMQRLVNHVRIEMTGASCCNLNGLDTVLANSLGVVLGFEVTRDHRDRQIPAGFCIKLLNGCFQQCCLAGAG